MNAFDQNGIGSSSAASSDGTRSSTNPSRVRKGPLPHRPRSMGKKLGSRLKNKVKSKRSSFTKVMGRGKDDADVDESPDAGAGNSTPKNNDDDEEEKRGNSEEINSPVDASGAESTMNIDGHNEKGGGENSANIGNDEVEEKGSASEEINSPVDAADAECTMSSDEHNEEGGREKSPPIDNGDDDEEKGSASDEICSAVDAAECTVSCDDHIEDDGCPANEDYAQDRTTADGTGDCGDQDDCSRDEASLPNAQDDLPLLSATSESDPHLNSKSLEELHIPTTVSGVDCMGKFSSVTGPSPAKLKVADMSLDTTIDSGEDIVSAIDMKSNNDDGDGTGKQQFTGSYDGEQQIRPQLLFRPDILSTKSSASISPRESATPSSELSALPATVSGVDCMTQFSTLKSPSPMKMNHFNFDVSMDTTVGANDSVLDVGSCDVDTCANDNIGMRDLAERSELTDEKLGSRSRRSPTKSDGDVAVKQTKRARMRNQVSNLSTTTSLLQQEYNVDHSCSTPLERLARDIGNTFRQWNVHQGCDWHVSLDWAEKMESLDETGEEEKEGDVGEVVEENEEREIITTQMSEDVSVLSSPTMDDEPVKFMSMDLCERGFASRTRRITSWMGDGDMEKKPQPQSPPSPTKPKHRVPLTPPRKSSPPVAKKITRDNSQRGARCIRTEKIRFQTMGYSPQSDDADVVTLNRRRYNIPLVLSLWDAPYFPTDGADDDTAKIHDALSSEEGFDSIPRSMRPGISLSTYSLLGELGYLSSCGTERLRYNASPDTKAVFESKKPSYTALKAGLTEDISSMFGVGQHITLCLDLSEIAQGTNESDVKSLHSDLYAYIENCVYDAIDGQRQATIERRRRQKQVQHQRVKRIQRDAHQLRKEQRLVDSDGHNYDDETKYPLVGVGSQSMSHDEMDEDDEIMSVSDEHDAGSGDSRDSQDSYDDDSGSYDDDDSSSLDCDIHLNQQEIHAEVTASLAAILQTALNLAASENDCSIPVFGIWGNYSGDSPENVPKESSLSLPWIPRGIEKDVLHLADNHELLRNGEGEDGCTGNILLSSPVLSGTCQSGNFRSSHRAYFVSQQVLPLHLSTLNGLANVLLAQCPHQDNKVTLTAARHCYHWNQIKSEYGDVPSADQDWRMLGDMGDQNEASTVSLYRRKCRQLALLILERASSPLVSIINNQSVPMWGPSEGSPLLALTASVSWGVISAREENAVSPPPLLQLPLKIRSTNFASTPSELLDMEYALQSAALDPIGIGVVEKEKGHEFGPREPIFLAHAEFNLDAPCATLSANTRCVLAALLRCGSLGLDVLPGHLTKKEILAKLGPQVSAPRAGESSEGDDKTESEKILRKALDLAAVGPVTRRLIDALDWGDIEMNLSSAEFDRGIAEVLQRIQSTTYPTPPVEAFSVGNTNKFIPIHRSQKKGSRPGRLLSILFAHMARLRTPPSMMRLWLSFVEELRTRWDRNESLPNLGFVPGLDNDGDAQHGQPHWGLQKADKRVLGHRADHAAFVNSSEPDPDRNHCIINQKLQVFNICIECKMSTEALHEKQMQADDESVSVEHSSDDDEFFDPEEREITFDVSAETEPDDIEEMLMRKASTMLSPHHTNRAGARCPVPDAMPLTETGDQLFAPYLQRTMPMTDEEEQKRKKFLGYTKHEKEERPPIRSRITIAQRLQKPKLLSDMAAFKAANDGAVFEDFVHWYGNPENPLDEEINGETARQALEYRSSLPPEEAKTLALEEASEAIAILMSLRAFWEDTWEEAEPCPAFEQEPLFDPYSTVEMVLHSFETIHPALLMNQVLSVQLSNARFVIESAADPVRQVSSIARGLRDLETAIDSAMERLTRDAADGFLHLAPKKDDTDPLVYVSTSTITSCEDACNAIGEMEILLSWALSLLQKFPGEYDLVDSLLRCKDGRFILVTRPKERGAFLGAIKRYQAMGPNPIPEATPAMREYILRNTDPSSPCQLGARLVPNLDEEQSASLFHGSMLLALTKCSS